MTMKTIEYLKMVKAIPEWDRSPAISDTELDKLLNIPPWDNPESECYGCKKHSIFDCKACCERHVNYNFLCNANIDLGEFGNSIQIDISNNKKFLRVTLFKDDHYRDEIEIDLIDEFGD